MLGTAGTLMVNRDFFRGSLGLIIHADNITNDNLEELIDTHVNKSKDSLLTMLTFKTDNPSQCGIVETNEKGVVTAFHEKTKNPPGFIANGAIYAFDQSFLDFLDQTHFSGQDISKDLLPKLLGRIQTCYSQTTFLDIGSPTTLSRAQELWKKESLNE
ncbi:putative sugar-phosphate nucleotidyl transferase [Prochlorococcus sp. SS52]|nr:putative sugar-phosphate nucleotidyl transferase [Prochlorococcus marinus str. SS2]KGG37310.1 putative sugar-phosphate nucleotidyl transferase [Prochlorococcus sp. SS52]